MADLPQRLAAVGVHLVFVEHLPGGKIDGAAFMHDANPVIAVSGRGKRFDKLFFALMHEIAHVLCGHAHEGVALDDAADAASDDPCEVEANMLAEQLALGGRVRIPAPISAAAVNAKAAALGVPYAFVVGNLQHQGVLDWRTTLARGFRTLTTSCAPGRPFPQRRHDVARVHGGTKGGSPASTNLQIIACAGSGKTQVITQRIARSSTTRCGAAQRCRLHIHGEGRCRAEGPRPTVQHERGQMTGLAEMFIGTMHGYCLDLLQRLVPEPSSTQC